MKKTSICGGPSFYAGSLNAKVLDDFQLQPQPTTLPSSTFLLPAAQDSIELRIKSAMASSSNEAERVEEAKALAKQDPAKAEGVYTEVLSKGPGSSEASQRTYEAALVGLGELYRDTKNAQELSKLLETSRSAFSSFAKAKTAKLGTST